jgi:hypothetical protein
VQLLVAEVQNWATTATSAAANLEHQFCTHSLLSGASAPSNVEAMLFRHD